MAFLQTEAFERIQAAHAAGRLAHAYLISGPQGSGKAALAADIAGLVLGEPSSAAMEHPDLHSARPESKSRRIVIDQMRELQKAMHQKPMRGARKLAVVFEADRLQPQAANAFLKTLEEPPGGSHVLLLSSHPDVLLDTIISRCIEVPLRLEGVSELSEAQSEVVAAVRAIAPVIHKAGITEALGFVRKFQEILQRTRTRVREEYESLFSAEKKLLKNTADEAWLREQEEQTKARAEAAASMERARLLESVTAVFAEALRLNEGVDPGNSAFSGAAREIASALDSVQLLRRMESLDRLASSLDRNVNEPLALEHAFLEIFCPLKK